MRYKEFKVIIPIPNCKPLLNWLHDWGIASVGFAAWAWMLYVAAPIKIEPEYYSEVVGYPTNGAVIYFSSVDASGAICTTGIVESTIITGSTSTGTITGYLLPTFGK